jgi:hypothetical protein
VIERKGQRGKENQTCHLGTVSQNTLYFNLNLSLMSYYQGQFLDGMFDREAIDSDKRIQLPEMFH